MNIVAMPCGCRTTAMTKERDRITFCPMHAAAERMVELTRNVERIFTRHGWCEEWEAPEASALREARAILREIGR